MVVMYCITLLLDCIIQGLLKVEFFDPIRECRIICRVDDALIPEKVEKALMRDHFRDLRVVSQSHNP
jgi:hypothetical protein